MSDKKVWTDKPWTARPDGAPLPRIADLPSTPDPTWPAPDRGGIPWKPTPTEPARPYHPDPQTPPFGPAGDTPNSEVK
jgi:hypothetical protein